MARVLMDFDALRPFIGDSERGTNQCLADGETISNLARRSGVPRINFHTWAHRGIPIDQADIIAVKGLGMHPSLIWPEWWQKCAQAPKCPCGELVPDGRTYCSHECRRSARSDRDKARHQLERSA
jgi:lambda repressor-like predicted transcriptional regulator